MEEPSSPRRQLDASYVWPVLKHYYAAVGIMTVLDTSVASVLSMGAPRTFYDISWKKLQNYARLRKMANTFNRDIVDGSASCYSGVEGAFRVRALDRKRWAKGIYYNVSVRNLVPETSPHKRIMESLDNFDASCDCPDSFYKRICRAPFKKILMFGDRRTFKSIPGAFVNSPLCKHVLVGLSWSHFVYGTASFGIFGPSEEVIRATEPLILRFLREKPKLPDYQLNLKLQQDKSEIAILNDLNNLIWRG